MYCDFGVPYPDVSCIKGHWVGCDIFFNENVDPWVDCLDFKDSIEHSVDENTNKRKGDE